MVKIVAIHMIISFALYIFMAVDWGLSKGIVFDNGWDIEKCDPVHPIEVWLYFIPVVNIIFTLLNHKFNSMLVETKNAPGVVLSIFIGPLGFHYSEWDDTI